MPMQHLMTQSPIVRAPALPFSDWQAQTQRILDRRLGRGWVPIVDGYSFWHGMFDCGLSPHDAADAYMED